MIAEYPKRIAFRLSEKERREVEKLIASGKFRNMSAVIRAALEQLLKNAETTN
jgi:Arc/MetJ-type ribon-helix-helix transcriptional regulator